MKTNLNESITPATPIVKRVAFYPRVSTQEQAQHGVSLAEQKERLERWAKNEGWEVTGIYTDEGYSGGTDERPGLKRLRADAKAGMFDIVAVTKLDRFFRNTRLLLNYIYELKAYGVTFVSQAEGIDTSVPGIGNVLLSTLGSFAEMERERIGERVKDFRSHLKSQGRWSSGRTPFGTRFDKETKELVTDLIEAEAVRFIFNSYTEKQIGIVKTAELCNKEDLITPRPGRRQHTTWTQSAVRHVLTHPAYKGGPNDDWPFKTPAIVTPVIWEKAQRQLSNNRHFREGGDKSPFQGLLRCGICGHTLRIGYNHNSTKAWECPGRLKRLHLDDSARCTLPRFNATKLEAGLVRSVSDIFSNPDTILKYIGSTIDSLKKEQTALERKLRPIQASRDKLTEQLGKADTMFQIGRLTTAEYKTRVAGIQAKIKEIDRQAEAADPLLLKTLKDNEKAIQYYERIKKLAKYERMQAEKESKRIENFKQGIFERAEPIFSPERFNLLDELYEDLSEDERPAFELTLRGLVWMPDKDIIYHPAETAGQHLRKLGLYCFVYRDSVEIKGIVRQTNVTASYT